MADLDGTRVALVTGAGHGLGLAVARALGDQGFVVLASARESAKAVAAAEAAGGDGRDVRPLVLDVADDASVRAAADEVRRDPGRLDVLVNNAAAWVDPSQSVSEGDVADAHRVFETNLFGPWRTIQAFLPLLRGGSHPRIVNVSSGAGSHGDPVFGLTTPMGGAAAYGASKAALNALTSKLAVELADGPVLVNAVCPGFTATFDGAEDMGARPPEESAEGVVWAATLPDDGPRGGFFRDREPLPW